MSLFTCIRTLLVIGLVLIPSLINAETMFGNEEDNGLMNQVRELLAKLKEEETTRGVDKDALRMKILALNSKYSDLIASNDVQGILDMYEPNAVRISNGVSKTGLDGLQSQIEAWINYVTSAELTTETLLPLDKDAKFVFEKKAFAMYGPSSADALNSGMTVMVWKLTDAGYKVAIELNFTS